MVIFSQELGTSLKNSLTESSNLIRRSCTKIITPAAVKVLVIDVIGNQALGRTGIRCSTSAKPYPSAFTILPFRNTATAIPGTLHCSIFASIDRSVWSGAPGLFLVRFGNPRTAAGGL